MAKRPKAPKLSDEQRFDWLRLIRSENVGPRTFRALINNCGGARAALEALPELARRGGAGRPIRVASVEDIERELAAARKLGVRYVAMGEPDYPPILRQIDSAPPVLAFAGREEALQQPAVAIVGSRNASAAGLTFADRLARGLGQAGYVVVSGLARGIDQRVHVASLETGAVGVLAGGHAKPYPAEAVPLIARMIEFGAVVSEMPIEWEPRGRDFPRRNRIVSGLALGTIVVEAARGSGSLITAKFALDQNRQVFAVPGSPLDPRAEGANDLLKQGATICTNVDDVVAALEPTRSSDVFASLEEGGADGEPLWGEQSLFGVDPDATPRTRPGDEFDDAGAVAYRSADASGGARDRIVALLGPSPISLDELARAAEASAREVRVALMELELAGRVEFSGGDRVALRPAGDTIR
jgi:DNA processing protein